MASTVTITTRPRYLSANNLVYTMHDIRPGDWGSPVGPGVAHYDSFRVMARQTTANASVDIGKTGVGLMTAWVRGTNRGGQGIYEVDNINKAQPTTDSYVSQLNVDISANLSGNPRVDSIILEVLDGEHAGVTNLAQIRCVAGSPTAGATLDNRNGAPAVQPNSILLADVIAANGFTTITATEIRDRRPWALRGSIPSLLGAAAIDMVVFEPAVQASDAQATAVDVDLYQSAALMYLPRRIAAATRLRWRYRFTGGTTVTGSYNIGIYDASGRKIVETGSVAFTGAADAVNQRSETIAATTFEPGLYYVAFGNDNGAAGSWKVRGVALHSSGAGGYVMGPTIPGAAMAVTSGGVTLPATLAGMSDATGAAVIGPPVPVVALSVG